MIAADSGLEHARAAGWHTTAVVGDLDSVDPAVLEAARGEGTVVQAHPTDKDQSDLELALDEAVRRGATSVIVLGVGGGRLDHFLASLFLLADARFAAIDVDARWEGHRAAVVRSRARSFRGRPGDVVTLLPIHGPARVKTEGLRWALEDEVLEAGSSRGLSNEFVTEWVWVHATQGTLLAIQIT